MLENEYGYMDRFAPDDYRLRLTVRLDSGKVLSGVYGYLEALARQEQARTWPHCVEAWTEEP